MVNEIFKTQNLENYLQHNWTDFLDQKLLMLKIMEDVRDTSFKEIKQQNIPPRQIKFSVTKFSTKTTSQNWAHNNYNFEFWVEFNIPKEKGVVIGTNIYLLSFEGEIKLHESFGTHFIEEDP